MRFICINSHETVIKTTVNRAAQITTGNAAPITRINGRLEMHAEGIAVQQMKRIDRRKMGIGVNVLRQTKNTDRLSMNVSVNYMRLTSTSKFVRRSTLVSRSLCDKRRISRVLTAG
jgi:hypothetical protein